MDGSKTVTRRLGWLKLNPGDLVRPVKKCMGLKKGERLDVLRDPILIIDTRRELLRTMTDIIEYGFEECVKEGFGNHPDYQWPWSFVEMFCATYRQCTPETMITRIEFTYDYDK